MFLSLTRVGWLIAIGVWFSGLGALWFSTDTIESNRATFQQLDSDAQREMLRKWERFQTLSNAEKRRLIDFDQQLAAHPDAAHLLSLIDQYYEWNLALSDRERADLAVASSDLRIERIQKFRMAQYASNLGRDESTRLSIEDLILFWEWSRERIRGNSEGRGGRPLFVRGGPALSTEELDDLQGRFSEKAAALMRGKAGKLQDGRDGRNELVANWLTASFQPTTTTLKSFYETLDETERAELMETVDMTREAINDVLKRKYAERMGFPWVGGGRGRPPGGPNSGGPGRGSGGPGRGPGGNQRPSDERAPNRDSDARTQTRENARD